MPQTEQIHKIFEEREKQILEEASRLAVEMARKELALLEFEMFNEVMISESSKDKAEKSLKQLRDVKWKKALEEASGDEEEAMLIYGAS